MVRSIVLALDESPHSRLAIDFCLQRIVRRPISALELHLTIVLPPTPNPVIPAVPMAGAVVTHSSLQAYQDRKQQDERHAQAVLHQLSEIITQDYKVPHDNVKLHVLPALGGASGVGESLVEACKQVHADLLVVGTRGMGYFKSSLMSFLGLGSVSDYCLHQANLPVMVVNHEQGKHPIVESEATPLPPAPPPKKVLLGFDDSPHARTALSWYLDKVAMPQDQIHLVTVVLTPPMMVGMWGGGGGVFEEPPAVAVAERMQYEQECAEALAAARTTVQRAVEQALQHGVMRTKVVGNVLNPQDGGLSAASSDVGEALCRYSRDKDIDLVIIGSRGLGAWRRSLMGVMGLGSVSDYVAHNAHLPLIVVKHSEGQATADTHNDGGALLPRLDEEPNAEEAGQKETGQEEAGQEEAGQEETGLDETGLEGAGQKEAGPEKAGQADS